MPSLPIQDSTESLKLVNAFQTYRLRLIHGLGEVFVPVMVLFYSMANCHGQGTMQFRFEGPAYTGAPYPQAPGTESTTTILRRRSVLLTLTRRIRVVA